ncbi:mannose-1-phosphate guanylyltransferase/mannose-6-phosphate isomerase [Polaromonas sp.]|uniref:mannose-1-phosphate guanylyltransferase/mannose-6-phosphate isomerase n=1 Tax=Polaromonas sp. TaxID=1869339 RepID=UPI0013B8629F|nr:mannose-1-phosphate guanylyltransferase/mannose-6-phosphate isomerase [Polaromonas sp.]NDP61468.1 mannose-1-phosphate guanylyltransferase/mannose-6-phosphate isomerase [Polaromonas sp.]
MFQAPELSSDYFSGLPADHHVVQPVILCGGSGTRLWPLSRKSFPKQFVPLIGDKSLLQLTLERVAQLGGATAVEVLCVAAEEHRYLVLEAMQAARVSGSVILEPVARNTAAAMALAALKAQPGQWLLFCPADHHIPDALAFAAMVEQGKLAAEQGAIVSFGVKPSYPSTAYGYIEQGELRSDNSYSVARFIEKPLVEKAQDLILQGNVLWNAGIFLCKASTLLEALGQHAPDILASCRKAMDAAVCDEPFIRPQTQAFTACRSESIDYAVMEHHTNIAVVPFAGAWSDVGSWNAVADMTLADGNGNRVDGQGLAIEATKTYIHAPYRPVVALGTHDLLIIDTPDAVLVATSSHAESVKIVVAELEARRTPQAAIHRKVSRPWGSYDSIDMGERFQVKRIVVKPGGTLSLQKHYHRAEHWIVVKGTAKVTRGDETFLLTENQSTYIPIGELHRLHNPGKTHLEMIEVQSGSYLGEDDIERYEDNYGRVIPVELNKKRA